MEVPASLERIESDLRNEGGESYLVGGAVIDMLKGREIKDWDVEVHKLGLERLEGILKNHGTPNLVGKSFGIIKLDVDGIDYDFSVPRRESNIGTGHKDFKIDLDPELTPKEAAYRRDLTINSMFLDLASRELVDPYNGAADLKQGILRHTGDQFAEDPLRVLRIMQLLPRKGKTVAPKTVELCKSLSPAFATLPKERVMEEFNKLLEKSNNPSMGLNFLVDSNWISHFPELNNLRYTLQNPVWHPEGNVWNHTLGVVDAAASLRGNLPKDWQRAYMYGALLHDVGKPSTIAEDLSAHGHDVAGVPLARNFFERITNEIDLTNKALDIVNYHMMPGELKRGNAKESAWKRLHNNIPLHVIAYMSKADSAGTGGKSLEDRHVTSEVCLDYGKKFGKEPIPALLKGRDLVSAGYTPGRDFADMLKYAYELQMAGTEDRSKLLEKVKQKF